MVDPRIDPVPIAEHIQQAFEVTAVIALQIRENGNREVDFAGVPSSAHRSIRAALRARSFELEIGPRIEHPVVDSLVQQISIVRDGVRPIAYINLCSDVPLSRRQRRALAVVMSRLERHLVTLRALSAPEDALVSAVLQANPRPVFVIAASGRIVRTNHAAAALLSSNPQLAVELREQTRSTSRFEVHQIAASDLRLIVMLDTSRDHVAELVAGLGTRALEVVRLLARGVSNKEIAQQLGLADNTVEYHLTRIYAKVGVRTRVQLLGVLADRVHRG